MDRNTHYLHLKNGIVIGYAKLPIDVKQIEADEKVIEIITETPEAYINLNETQIYEDPLPSNVVPLSIEEQIRAVRAKMNVIHSEVLLSQALNETHNSLDQEFHQLKLDYEDLKQQLINI